MFGHFIVATALAVSALAQECANPALVPNFNTSSILGTWYEIARIQTEGASIIQNTCVCTTLQFEPYPDSPQEGDLLTTDSCRYLEPYGPWLNATSYLLDMNPPGHWEETYFQGGPETSFNVILQGVDELTGYDWAVEYDCSNNDVFGYNYCVHIMSRVPTMSAATFWNVISTVNNLNLNVLNRPLNITRQYGCWNSTVDM